MKNIVGVDDHIDPQTKQKQTNKLMSNAAITLIALVITIIVLLILAGVALNMVIGENGIFRKANTAKEKNEYSAAKEIVDLKLTDIQSECIINKEEYTLQRIATEITLDTQIIIEQKYFNQISKKRDSVSDNVVDLKGIVVSVDKYTKYKFLIGKSGDSIGIIGSTTGNIPDTWKDGELPEGFETVEIDKTKNVSNIKDEINNLITPVSNLNYKKDGLVLWLDGYYNNGTTHSTTTTTWKDLSGNNNDFTVNGNCTWDETSIVMNGTSSDNVSINECSDIINALNDVDGDGFTVSILIKTNSSDNQGIMSCGVGSTNCGFHETIRGSTFRFCFYGNDYITSNYSTYANTYTAIDCVYDNGKKYVYFNGNLYGNQNSNGLNVDSSQTFYLGKDIYNSIYTNGNIASVRIYNKALNASDIQNNYDTDNNRMTNFKVAQMLEVLNETLDYQVDSYEYKNKVITAKKMYDNLSDSQKLKISSESTNVLNNSISTVEKNSTYGPASLYLACWLDGENNTRSGHSNSAKKWEDLSGNNNDFTVNGNCTWNNNSITMNGTSSDNVSINECSDIINALNNVDGDGFTVSILVKTNSSDNQGIMSCGESDTNCGFHETIRGSTFRFCFYNNDYVTSNYSTYANVYTAIDCVYDNGKKYVYFNGNLYGNQNSNGLNVDSSQTFYLGKDRYNSIYTNGNIAVFQIYNKALTEPEIQSNYNVNKLRFNL